MLYYIRYTLSVHLKFTEILFMINYLMLPYIDRSISCIHFEKTVIDRFNFFFYQSFIDFIAKILLFILVKETNYQWR